MPQTITGLKNVTRSAAGNTFKHASMQSHFAAGETFPREVSSSRTARLFQIAK